MFRRLVASLVIGMAVAVGAHAQISPVCAIENDFAGAFESQPGDYTVIVNPDATATLRANCTAGVNSFDWSPGAVQTSQISVIAPAVPGDAAEYTLTGCFSGTSICAVPVTITVQATAAPVPNCTLTANPNPVVLGASTTLTAACTGVTPTRYAFLDENLSVIQTTAGNTLVVTPTNSGTISYYVRAFSGTLQAPLASVQVSVLLQPPPSGCTVSAAPNPVTLGASTVLTALCTGGGAPTTYAFTPPAGAVISGTSNTLIVTPTAIGTQTYTMVASNSGGSAPPATVDVVAQAAACNVSASLANPVPRNTPVTLSASCNNQPVSYSWSTAAGPIAGAGGASITVTAAVTTTYTVSASSSGGTVPLVVATGQYTVVLSDASAIAAVAGGPLVGAPGRPLSRALQVRVADALGNPVAQELVNWSVVNPGASPGSFAANPSPATDAQGLTSNTFIMGVDTGGRTLRACLAVRPGVCVDFLVQSLNAALERPTAKIMSPMAELAVGTPLAQLRNIRFRLEQLRLRRNPSIVDALHVSVAGRTLPSFSAFALAPLDKNGKPIPQKGGGAAADDPFERLGVFVNGDVEIGRQSGTGVQNGYDLRTKGVTVGADYRLPGDSVVGFAAGFMNAGTDLAEAGGSQGARGYSLSAYGSFVPASGAYFDVIAHAGGNHYDTRRREVAAAGPVDYNSNTRGNQYAFAITAGADVNRGALTMNPYLRMDYINATINRFSESGDDGAIQVGELDLKTAVVTVGGQLNYAISTSWGVLLPNARLELQRRVQDDGRNVSAQLVADGTVNTQVKLESVDKDYGNVSVGFSAVLPRGVSGFANYERLFGRAGYNNSKYTVGVRFEF